MKTSVDSREVRRHHLRAVFLGPPGSGKGTQAAAVCERMGLARVATGDMLRANVKEGTELGKKADAFMKAGKLVPDELVMAMLFERLQKRDCLVGFVLDGFPRNKAQAEALDREGFAPDVVLHFVIEDAAIVKRIEGRQVCGKCGANYHRAFRPAKKAGVCDACGGELLTRKDDNPESVKERLKVYHAEADALVEYYKRQGKARDLVADRPAEKITEDALRVLESARPSAE